MAYTRGKRDSRGYVILNLALQEEVEPGHDEGISAPSCSSPRINPNKDMSDAYSSMPSPGHILTYLQDLNGTDISNINNYNTSSWLNTTITTEDPLFTPNSDQELLLETSDFLIENNIIDESLSDKENSETDTNELGRKNDHELSAVNYILTDNSFSKSVDGLISNLSRDTSHINNQSLSPRTSTNKNCSSTRNTGLTPKKPLAPINNNTTPISFTSDVNSNDMITPKTRTGKKKKARQPEEQRKRQKFKHPILPPCGNKCYRKCFTKMTDVQRELTWKGFWELDTQRRRDYISRHISRNKISVRYAKSKRRNNTLIYRLGQTQVCQPMFLHTLGYKNDSVVRSVMQANYKIGLDETSSRISAARDQRGKHKPPHAFSDDYITVVEEFIDSFKPTPSHYNIKHAPNRKYLPYGCTYSILFKMLLEHLSEKDLPKCSWTSFHNIMKKKNISTAFPDQDICTKCKEHKTIHPNIEDEHQSAATDQSDKHKCEDCVNCKTCAEFPLHILNKKNARRLLKKDEKDAETSAGKVQLFTVDMQKVISMPKLSTKDYFFARKLILYNETFVQTGKNKKAVCVLWHEGESGRKAYNVATAFIVFIQKYCRDLTKVIFYMDNCTSQNKNKTLYSVLLRIVNDSSVEVETIKITYLEPGHTFMAADSVHACIARKINTAGDLYDYEDFQMKIKASRRNLEVQSLRYKDFVKFEDEMTVKFPKSYNISNLKVVEFRRGSTKLFAKNAYEQAEFLELNVYKKSLQIKLQNAISKGNDISVHTLTDLDHQDSCSGINKKKKEDLLKLAKCMPASRRVFFENLEVNENLPDDYSLEGGR